MSIDAEQRAMGNAAPNPGAQSADASGQMGKSPAPADTSRLLLWWLLSRRRAAAVRGRHHRPPPQERLIEFA